MVNENNYALHKTSRDRPRKARLWPTYLMRRGLFWPTYNFEMSGSLLISDNLDVVLRSTMYRNSGYQLKKFFIPGSDSVDTINSQIKRRNLGDE